MKAEGTASGPTVVANPVAQLGAKSAANAVANAVADAHAAWLAKPWQTTAVGLSFVSVALTVLSTFTPWFFVSTGPAADVESGYSKYAAQVSVYPVEMRYCADTSDVRRGNNTDPAYVNSKECTVVQLSNIAPVLDYFYTSGTVALTFLVFAMAVGIPAAYVTYLRRIGSLWRIPEQLQAFRKPIAAPLLHFWTTVFLTVAWGHYIGSVQSGYKAVDLEIVVIPWEYLISVNNLHFQEPAWSYGFAMAVTAFNCSLVCIIITAVFKDEISRESNPNAGIAAVVAGAYNDDSVKQLSGNSPRDWGSGGSSTGGASVSTGRGFGSNSDPAAMTNVPGFSGSIINNAIALQMPPEASSTSDGNGLPGLPPATHRSNGSDIPALPSRSLRTAAMQGISSLGARLSAGVGPSSNTGAAGANGGATLAGAYGADDDSSGPSSAI